MKTLRTLGLGLILAVSVLFISLLFMGQYTLSSATFENFITQNNITSSVFIKDLEQSVVDKEFSTPFYLANTIAEAVESANTYHKANKEWAQVIWTKPHSLAYQMVKSSGTGIVVQNKRHLWFLSFGLAILGALLFMLPALNLKGPPGIKNNHIFHNSATNRGWIAWLVFTFLILFYLVLYFRPSYMVNWIYLVDPISKSLSGNPASKWFLYGFLYCVIMTVMAVRMYIKYRHNKYQTLRTTSVLFFQIVFAFLIPEILVRFEKPWYDFKNAFPLDYDFFFRWNLNELLDSGGFGLFILVWGVVLTLVIVPVMVYFFGKRWYCSWVCGCGGLAETLGDPYRQLSSKSLLSWKVERWLVHGVLVFALLMTGLTLYGYFAGTYEVLGIKVQTLQDIYGFLIGSIFAGVIGTGFYPIFGNRVWCRFGCPLAAYMGVIQRFKSRFRITTNGGQCISCGNCSTYCEQGIDVRAYAQKGENIVRASCVGCGVCSAVCPRGVLKLENGPEEGRIGSSNILLGNEMNLMDQLQEK
jgi:Pyruvate/2-oxoacid:ferredoxin oxidoreductase delta subunit